MGIVSSLLSQSNNNMKFLLVLAVAAYVKGDADPGFAYSVGHLPLAYAHAPLVYTAAHAPVVYTAPAAGCQNSEGKFVPCAQGSYFGYVPVAAAAAPAEEAPAVEAERKKRDADADATAEADADPEADPWLYYSGLYGHHGYGYGYNYAPLTYSYSHVYGHYGLGHYGYHGRKKRDAEAEPTADATPKLTHGCCTVDMGMVGMPTLPTHTLPTTTLSHISMEDAETTKEPWYHVLADKQDMYLDS